MRNQAWRIVVVVLSLVGPGSGSLVRAEPPAATNVAALAPLAFQKNDVLVFLGDSITEKGEEPDGFVTLVSDELLRQRPDLLVRVVGAGQGWDKLASVRDRLNTTVLCHKPSKVIVEIGLNDLDVQYSGTDAARKIFALGLRDLVWRIRGGGAEPILTTLTLVGEKPRGQNEYDALTDDYSQIIRDVATARQCHVIDLREPLLAYDDAHNTNHVAEGFLTVAGGTHLSPLGNRVVADQILQAFGLQPVGGGAPAPAAAPAAAGAP